MHRFYFVASAVVVTFLSSVTHAFTLWSTESTHGSTGEFLGPGAYEDHQPLYEMVLRNLLFDTERKMTIPFANNGASTPNLCGEGDLGDPVDGKLSDGTPVNENADMCLATVASTDMLIAVVGDGPLAGQQEFLILDDGNILVAMDIAFDLGIGEKGIVRMPFYGTTGRVQIPASLQSQLDIPGGVERAGRYPSGSWLDGAIGDFDEDGLLDGTMVSAGNIPLDSPVFPGQPYAMIRHFEIDIPAEGTVLGDVKQVIEMAGKPGLTSD